MIPVSWAAQSTVRASARVPAAFARPGLRTSTSAPPLGRPYPIFQLIGVPSSLLWYCCSLWQLTKGMYDSMEPAAKLGRLTLPWSMFAYPFYLVSDPAGKRNEGTNASRCLETR